jgi:hypothetical protein
MPIPLAAAPVIAGLKYLPLAGAALGGIGAYRQSGGNLGATALGSGLGALQMAGVGGLSRMAGAKLAGTGLAAKVAPEAFKAGAGAKAALAGMGPQGIAQAVKTAGTAAPIVQQMGGQQVLAQALPVALAGGATLALAPGAAKMAADVAGPNTTGLGQAAQVGAGMAGYQPPGAPDYAGTGVPTLDQYGNITPYGSLYDVAGPTGMARRQEQLLTGLTGRDLMRALLPEVEAAVDARSQKELARNLAAAGVRQNIATRAAMLQRSQQAGLEAGRQALATAGQGLIQQYQYQ